MFDQVAQSVEICAKLRHKVMESFLQQEQNLMTTDVFTRIMKRAQMCASHVVLKESRRERGELWGADSFNNSTLCSKETQQQLSDPAACNMHSFNLFNWALNFFYEAPGIHATSHRSGSTSEPLSCP